MKWPFVAAVVIALVGCSDEPSGHEEPLGDPHCDSAAVRFTGPLPSGPGGQPSQYVSIRETTSGQWFCLGGATGEAMPIGLDSTSGPDTMAQVTDAGNWNGPGMWYLFVLPSELPDGLDVRAAQTSS